MKIYTALLKPNAEPVLVREGFAWGAFILGPIWLAAHRAWIAAAITLALFILIDILTPQPARTILATGLAVLLGLIGNDLRRWALQQRGFLLMHVLAAQNTEDAFARLLTTRPDLAARFRPEPA